MKKNFLSIHALRDNQRNNSSVHAYNFVYNRTIELLRDTSYRWFKNLQKLNLSSSGENITSPRFDFFKHHYSFE